MDIYLILLLLLAFTLGSVSMGTGVLLGGYLVFKTKRDPYEPLFRPKGRGPGFRVMDPINEADEKDPMEDIAAVMPDLGPYSYQTIGGPPDYPVPDVVRRQNERFKQQMQEAGRKKSGEAADQEVPEEEDA